MGAYPSRDAGTRAFPIVIVGHVDHGKSTLVGRLLHDTDSLPDGKLDQLRSVSEKRGLEFEWSFLLDALQVERDQGITVDVTQIWFHTAQRRYVIIDAPGHKEFLKNMVTGASRAHGAVLVVDAKVGVSEQTRRHAYLLHLLGVAQVVVAVNKMDLVQHDQQRLLEVEREITGYLGEIGIRPRAVIPVSARNGDNIAERSTVMGWYRGPTITQALDGFARRPSPIDAPLRLPVQDVYRIGDRRAIVGRIESGRVSVGDTVQLSPTGRRAHVASIEDWNRSQPRETAGAGESVALTLDEEIFAVRGHLLTAPEAPPAECRAVAVRVFWFDEEPLRAGRRMRARYGTADVDVTVAAIEKVVDVETLDSGPATHVERNGVAEVVLRSTQPLYLDKFADNPRAGRGVLMNDYKVVGGFIVERPLQASRNITAIRTSVSRPEREKRNGHRGAVFWLTGLSGSGKSTIANGTLRRLFDNGWQVQLLDGDNLRDGLNADLGFVREDRAENLRRTAHVARLLAESGVIVLAALISPYARDRAEARRIVGDGFYEIHVHADVEVCRLRDPKGLYSLAASGQVASFTGVSAPYEIPVQADLVLDTTAGAPERSIEALVGYVNDRCGLGVGERHGGWGAYLA
ncbi:adenylyl-sulfate kinase [Reyranella sp. CPCC 100927]|uniref:adenylyl-sulfate kinase n=1 Tax=Reyranella sp. CPCC 100927 TaxID=2599616 RepID=UPI0011B7DEE1|nr:adenylyl-sulfate kinase [Reyranella sp. CPCC 100927]TWT15858.1 adenylyl-sulfate kinase [Reyranella sp. CPCC 100927]